MQTGEDVNPADAQDGDGLPSCNSGGTKVAMVESIRRNIALIVGVTVCSAILLMVVPLVASPRGASGPTLLQSPSGITALIGFSVLLFLATGVAIVVSRLVNTAVGLFTLGGGLFILGLRFTTVQELAFGGGSVWLEAVECVLLAALMLPVVIVTFRFGGPLDDIHPRHPDTPLESWFGLGAIKAASAGLLMLPAIWVVARSPMNGQVFAAACFGGLLAGLIGRLINPHVQPILIYVTPVLTGAIGFCIVGFRTGASIESAFVDGTISPFARLRPIDYAAGSLAGVSMGLGWAKSFLVHEDQ